MKKILLLLFIGSSMLPLAADELTVMTYNIWNGFDWGKETERKELFIDYIAEQDVDVLALQELNKFNSRKLADMAKAYGHEYSAILKSSGYPVGITSKYPITVKKRKKFGFWHGFLHVKIQDVDYIVVHLSPAESSYRMKETEYIIEYLEKKTDPDSPVIILGDFNSHAETDEAALLSRPQLLENYQNGDVGKKEEKHNLYNNYFDFRIINRFIEAGYQDAAVLGDSDIANQWTFPTFALKGEEESLLGERIDYQMASGPLANSVIRAEILRDEQSMKLSDHYPVKITYQR